ncbi:MAG: hypothetical protein R6X23_15280 [Acidimicrobiia bacterium]
MTVLVLALVFGAVGYAATAGAGVGGQGEPADGPLVTLLERGDRPRTPLRYAIPVGATQTIKLRTFTNISQSTGKQLARGGTPNTTFTISATVAEVSTAGDLRIDYRYDDVEVFEDGSPSYESTKAAVEPVVGLTGSVTVTDQGELVASTQVIPDGIVGQARTVLEQLGTQTSQLTSPFPAAAVGKGARWRVKGSLEVGGIEFTQSTTYTLERISGPKGTVSTEIRQRAGRQEFTPPGSDQTFLVLSSVAVGTGESQFNLRKYPLPVGGSSNVSLRQRLRADGERLNQTISTNVFINK